MKDRVPVGVSRRTLINALAVGATAATTGLALAGCSPGGGSSGSGRAASKDKLVDLVPEYAPNQVLEPDLPSKHGGPVGYTSYPEEFRQAFTDKPGRGGAEITAMTPAWWPVPPGLGKNSYYDAVNQALGATMRFNVVSGEDYGEKLSAVLAAQDVPELTHIPDWNRPSGFSTAVQKLFTDLTPYLAGKKGSRYQMLAALPTGAWISGVWNEKLYGIPFTVGGEPPFALFYRKDILDELGVSEPRTADDLYQVGKELTDPKAGRWAFGDVFLEMMRAFGAPQSWRVTKGKLVNQIETDEFAAAVEFTRKLYDEKLVHPDIVAGQGDWKQLFESGKTLIYSDGIGAWHEALGRQLSVNPDFDMQPVQPYAADGGKPIYYVTEGSSMMTYVRKGLPEDRITELLHILDWIASPFGTQENQLIEYGLEGKHHTRGKNGAPTKTKLGEKEATSTYRFLAGTPAAITQAEFPGFVRSKHAWLTEALQYKEVQPQDGLHVEEPSHLVDLGKKVEDRRNSILRGREPLSALPDLVKWWRKNGGEELRDFYTKVLRKAGRL